MSVQARPPDRLIASRMTNDFPAICSVRAAPRPAAPAPMMATSTIPLFPAVILGLSRLLTAYRSCYPTPSRQHIVFLIRRNRDGKCPVSGIRTPGAVPALPAALVEFAFDGADDAAKAD